MRVIQGCFSEGFGGLELVFFEFHQWLQKRGVEAHAIVAKNSRLESELLRGDNENHIHSFDPGLVGRFRAKLLRQSLDGPQTAHLFHRHRGLKALLGNSLSGTVSVLNHTFMSVQKHDLLHQRVFAHVHNWIALTALHRLNLHENLNVPLDKIFVIPNGVDLKKFTPQVKEIKNPLAKAAPIAIGVVARLDPQKGQDLAIRALALLRQRGLNVELHLFGEDTPKETPFSPKLRELVNSLNLTHFVHFTGFIRRIEDCYSAIDLLWLPSHKETFGRCLLEAMATKVPVVASDAGGVVDIIRSGENGLLFQTKNENSLADVTERLLRSQNLLQRIVQNGYSEVKIHYDQEKIWDQLFKVIVTRNPKMDSNPFGHTFLDQQWPPLPKSADL